MPEEQETIEVWLGNVHVTTVPKVAESWIRKEYFGKPEEKKLIIKSKLTVSEEDRKKIIKKLTPA